MIGGPSTFVRESGSRFHARTAQPTRAFEGLKRLYYRGGTAAACRGTGSGPAQYYRTRPIGYYEMSLFTGAMGPRAG